MLADEDVASWDVAGKKLKTAPISRQFLRESLELAGFNHITIDFLPWESMPASVAETLTNSTSAMFIVATKNEHL